MCGRPIFPMYNNHIMSLFAIGDLHLHFQSELKAPGQLYDPVWKGHEEKFRENCCGLVFFHPEGLDYFFMVQAFNYSESVDTLAAVICSLTLTA